MRSRFPQSAVIAATILLATTLPSKITAAPPGGHGHHAEAATGGVQSLDVAASGSTLHLLLGQSGKSGGPVALQFLTSINGGRTWTDPAPVGEGFPAPHNARRGMDPQIAASGDQLVAVWMTKGTGLFDSGPMVTALSSDGGRTWRPGPNPADDGSTGGHGFIDLAADASGTFHLVWLDSRDGKQGLRYSASRDGGATWQANQTVDPETCECCWNSLATTPNSVAVLYRDKDPRDMRIATTSGTAWSPLPKAGEFNWQFDGCPHVGGGIGYTVADGKPVLHQSTWTGAEGKTGLYYCRFIDNEAGVRWSEPVKIGMESAWRSDLATNGERIAIAWDNQAGVNAGVFVTTSADGGQTWEEPTRLSRKGTAANLPRVISTGETFRVFWTEQAAGNPVRWISAEIK